MVGYASAAYEENGRGATADLGRLLTGLECIVIPGGDVFYIYDDLFDADGRLRDALQRRTAERIGCGWRPASGADDRAFPGHRIRDVRWAAQPRRERVMSCSQDRSSPSVLATILFSHAAPRDSRDRLHRGRPR